MPRGPKGEKRPADVIGAAIMVARIATGEVTDAPPEKRRQSLGRQSRRKTTGLSLKGRNLMRARGF